VRVLIAGCGYVGSALAAELVARGDEVQGLKRTPEGLPDGVVPVVADVTDRSTLARVPADLDAVVYAVSADRRDEAAYRAAYVDGLANVLGATGPVARVIHVSSTAVYGQTDGSWVDEDSPTEPSGFSGRTLLEGEGLARRAGGTVLRLAGIYGPTRTRLVDQVRSGQATCPPQVRYTNRIHRDDCAGALAHLLRLGAPDAVYNAADDDPAERCEVLTWLADQLGAPTPRLAAEPSARGGNKRISNRRLTASGYDLHYPSFRDGYAAMLG
jgi:nucleoside-diphosphate-sugar epimerase